MQPKKPIDKFASALGLVRFGSGPVDLAGDDLTDPVKLKRLRQLEEQARQLNRPKLVEIIRKCSRGEIIEEQRKELIYQWSLAIEKDFRSLVKKEFGRDIFAEADSDPA